ncbi:hypothetical protein DAPPUDRAFT_302760 [Daphnia pulex]|uniref:Carboxylesterase type B domain-containing protein n=1 Tax=Daphnia pulex TaxID=6669 RepID=E9HPQ1_DAPPU|nr:hypothetical protein DAPPUDRAFT_302760 [Daphnia pulex]|eukprot:EFX66295.1 hypothetical protein DAPPUDRAFT_302760 [Daphnia pulex]
MKRVVTFICFSIGVSHAQLMRNYNDHHRHKLLTDASAAPPIIGEANYFIPIANNYHDVGGKVIDSWSYLQPVLVSYTDHRDLHVDPVANLLVEPFRVQGDVLAKADVEAAAVVAAKAANVADPVRMKRKNILRYRNGEFRPRLCSPRLCLSVRPP